MPAVSISAKQQISKIIKKFKFKELEQAVLPVFPEFTWKDIKSQLVENHESFTTDRAVKIIEDEINKAKITQNTLKDRLDLLEVIDASRHYMKKIWYASEFRGEKSSRNLKIEELEEKIEKIFNSHQLKISAKAVQYNDLIFLSIKEKPKKKERTLPMFFSLLPKENFFFASKKVMANHVMVAVAEAMGYKGYKSIKLDGRNIPSLVRLLNARKIGVLTGFSNTVPRFKKAAPEKSSCNGMDFTQYTQRRDYADKCFGDDPPTFETLKVITKDLKWKDSEAREKLPHEVIYTKVQVRTSNIANMLKELVSEKVLEVPLPVYAANIMSLGRNEIALKKNYHD